MGKPSEAPVQRWRIVALGAILVAYWGYALPHTARSIEQDLAARTRRALADARITAPDGAIEVHGRNVTIHAARGSALASNIARDAVAEAWGVEGVAVRVFDPPPPPAPVTAPPASAQLSPEALKLEEELRSRIAKPPGIVFYGATDHLAPGSRILLDQVALLIRAASGVEVKIEAHTDSDGDAARNVSLSQRRAEAVRNYLVSRGVPPERLETEGLGSSKPLRPNDTPANKAQNRRIEFHAQ